MSLSWNDTWHFYSHFFGQRESEGHVNLQEARSSPGLFEGKGNWILINSPQSAFGLVTKNSFPLVFPCRRQVLLLQGKQLRIPFQWLLFKVRMSDWSPIVFLWSWSGSSWSKDLWRKTSRKETNKINKSKLSAAHTQYAVVEQLQGYVVQGSLEKRMKRDIQCWFEASLWSQEA